LLGNANKNTITFMLKQIQVAYDFYFQTNCKFGYKEPPILPNFQDQKMEEKKTLIKRPRFKGHKKIEELRHQASHISITDLSLHL
jgi:hypothetical protein